MALLDANVVKELNDLYRFGLGGIRNQAQVRRVQDYLDSKARYREIFVPQSATELCQPHSSHFSPTAVDEITSNVMYIHRLSGSDLVNVRAGAIPSMLRSARSRRRFRNASDVFPGNLPVFIPELALVTCAWNIAESGLYWKLALAELIEVSNRRLEFNPGLALAIATSLVAGTTDDARKLHAVMKFGRSLQPQSKAKRIRSAVWDIHTLDSLIQMPLQAWIAARENLNPICLLTADEDLAQMNALIGRRISYSRETKTSSLRQQVPISMFSADRLQAIRDFWERVNAGSDSRGAGPRSVEQQRHTLSVARQILIEQGDDSWEAYIQQCEKSDVAWWTRAS